jgi:membrane protein
MGWLGTTGIRWKEFANLLQVALNNWSRHNIPRLGASLAFYTLLSLAPLLVVIITIASVVFGREAAEGQLVWQIQDWIGHAGAVTVQTLLKSAQRPGVGIVATTLGLLALLYGATAVVTELRSALNTIWGVPAKQETGLRSLLSILVDRGLSSLMVLGVGFLLLISLAINATLSALGGWFNRYLSTPEWALQFVNFVVSYALITILFGLLYKVVPDLDVAWRDVILGAAFTSLLFGVGKMFIGLYLGKAGIASPYGAAGSLVVVLVWVYYSAQLFFLGAEFTQAYALRFGSRPRDRIGHRVQIVAWKS